MWIDLVGAVPVYLAGNAAGSVAIPTTVAVMQIIAHATTTAGSLTIFGGASIPVPLGVMTVLDFKHLLWTPNVNGGNANIVFTGAGIDMYFIHGVRLGNV